MANFYNWIQYKAARQQLAARLADPNNFYWTDAENGYYLTEALRTFNSLTELWNTDFAFQATNAQQWYDFAVYPNSPRLRTVTDTYLYTMMEYHLLEPPTGGTWTGTSQFGISDLQNALQRRRDEMIQFTGCNVKQLPALPSTPGTRRAIFADSTLEPRRARFIPDSAYGGPITLNREDVYAFDGFEAGHYQTNAQPSAWDVLDGPPLTLTVDTAPYTPGVYDVLSLVVGPYFAAPRTTVMGIPDDWTWVAKWGAMSDLLGRESEATDRQRADYCLKRFQQGMEVMKQSNWLVQARLNGVPVDTPSVIEQDGFSVGWQTNASAWPAFVTAGMDFGAVCPTPPAGNPQGVSLVLVGNAPVPILDTDYVQISRDWFDVILDYAQRLAAFKMGGADFAQTADLEKNFVQAAVTQNKRLSKLGIFSDMLHMEGKRQDLGQPR